MLSGLRGEGSGFEAHEAGDEGEGDIAGSAISVFGEDEVRFAFIFFLILGAFGIVGLSVEEADHVGILLDGPRFTEVRHAGDAEGGSGPAFWTTVELGEDDDGDVEFLRDGFQPG